LHGLIKGEKEFMALTKRKITVSLAASYVRRKPPRLIESGWLFFMEKHMLMVMIDNYDSFTHNLVQLFYEFDVEVRVFRNDEITLAQIALLGPHWICISPGPKDPAHAGISKAVIRRFGSTVPILGVCLGMQAINEVFDGLTARAPQPVHGKRSRIEHNGSGVFSGLPSPIWVARYHSLQVIVRSPLLVPLAYASDRVVMALQHESWPIWGVQFHPESFLSEYGRHMAANFLALRPKWRNGPHQPHCAQDRFPEMGPPEVESVAFPRPQIISSKAQP
jgi:anthranilate synthase component 2